MTPGLMASGNQGKPFQQSSNWDRFLGDFRSSQKILQLLNATHKVPNIVLVLQGLDHYARHRKGLLF